MKRKISIFLIMVMLSLSVSNAFCITSKADMVDDVRNDIYWALTHAAGTMGYIFGPNARDAIYDFACNSLSWIPVYEETGQAEGVTYDATTGLITMNAAVMQELKDCIDEYFAQEDNVPDIAWLPIRSYKDYTATNFYSLTEYRYFQEYCQDKEVVFLRNRSHGNANSSHDLYAADLTDKIFYYSGTDYADCYTAITYLTSTWGTDTTTNPQYRFYLATNDGVGSSMSVVTLYDNKFTAKNSFNYVVSYINSYSPKAYYNGSGLSTLCNGIILTAEQADFSYMPVFNGLNAYKEYVTGGAEYYQLTPTYQGGALTIDPNIDYGKLYDAVSSAMSNSAANGENVTQQLSAMQSAYETTMQEISGTLGDIEDNTEQSNSWLEKIYNNTASIASILIEQFDAMTETINNGFASVVDGLSDVSLGLGEIGDGSGGGSNSGGSKLSFWDKLGNFFGTTLGGVFDLISIIIMKALDGVGWLADKLIDNLGKALDGVSEIMDRYTKKITDNNTLSKLGEAIPPELKDLFTFFFFGVIGAGIIRAAKK